MPAPATTGQLRTNIANMIDGDYIICDYQTTSGTFGTFSNFGGSVTNELPVLGSSTPNGSFYFLKVNKGLLIADRIVQISISWNTMNNSNGIQGNIQVFGSYSGIIRSLTGGVIFADANGDYSTTNQNNGCWPTNNEWDKYIVNSNLGGKIIEGDNNTWNWQGVATWTQDTPSISLFSADYRTVRGSDSVNLTDFSLSPTEVPSVGFRPVFEYRE